MRAVLAILALVTAGGSETDDVVLSPPSPPCSGVYGSAVNACVASSGCAGFACFWVWDQCSADAKRGPLQECCFANYPTAEQTQACVDSLGQGP